MSLKDAKDIQPFKASLFIIYFITFGLFIINVNSLFIRLINMEFRFSVLNNVLPGDRCKMLVSSISLRVLKWNSSEKAI